MVDGLLDEGRHHAERRRLEDAQRALVEELGVPSYELPLTARRGRPGRALRAGRGAPRAGPRMSARPRPTRARAQRADRSAGRDPRAEAAPRRRRPARRPRPRHHRVLRLRRRRQDHHVRGARPARGRARPQGRGADHRPRAPAGPVDGHRVARQHPPAGVRRSTRAARRVARRDDARHEAHLRRGGAEPGHPEKAEQMLAQPVLHRGVELVRGHAGVHGDGEAGPARQGRPPHRPLGPDRGGHPTRRAAHWTSWTRPSASPASSTAGS